MSKIMAKKESKTIQKARELAKEAGGITIYTLNPPVKYHREILRWRVQSKEGHKMYATYAATVLRWVKGIIEKRE